MKRHEKLSLALVLCGSLAGACGTTKVAMDRSAQVPAAEGQVKVKEKKGENSVVEVDVKHLAPPDRLGNGATSYVVWVQPLDRAAQPQNVGALALGKDLGGKLQTVTVFDKFEVFVTAEPDEKTMSPTGQRVLWSRVQ